MYPLAPVSRTTRCWRFLVICPRAASSEATAVAIAKCSDRELVRVDLDELSINVVGDSSPRHRKRTNATDNA